MRLRPHPADAALRRGVAATCLALAAATAGPARALDRPSEYAVKAAMLLNVLKFVEWPGALPGGPALQACALGAPRFAAALASAAQGGAVPLVVREVRTPAGLAGCQFAIVGPDFREGLESLAERLTSQGVLTVSDTEGFGAAGVLVNFVLQGDRVRFEVNLEAARRAGLRFSSKLLRLAIVLGGAP